MHHIQLKNLERRLWKDFRLKKFIGKLYQKSLKAYKKQKNYVNRLYKKENFFNSLNPSVVSDNQKFWKL